MTSSMDTRTWHDHRPTHRKMNSDEVAARQAENMAWDAADEYLTNLHDGLGGDYETYNTLRTLAENASESLRAVKHQINIGQ